MTVKASLTNQIVHKLKSNQSISSKKILDLFKDLENENPISILSFLLHIQEYTIKIDNEEEKEFKKQLFILTEKIKELPQKLLCLYKNVNYELNEESNVIEEFNLLKDIQSIILKCLLQHSSKEIENIIFSYFNPKKMFKKINMVDSLLDKIYEINNFENIITGIKNLVLYIDQENIRKALDYFIKNESKEPFYFKKIKNKDLFCQIEKMNKNINSKIVAKFNAANIFDNSENCDIDINQSKRRKIEFESKFLDAKKIMQIFFYNLYLQKPLIYDNLLKIILNESFYSRIELIKILPYFTINFEENILSEDLIKFICDHKPILKKELTLFLLKNKRSLLIKIVNEFYNLFDVSELDFTFDEHVKICENNSENIYFVFENLLSNELIDFFVAIILKKDHVFLIQFFSFYLKKKINFTKKLF